MPVPCTLTWMFLGLRVEMSLAVVEERPKPRLWLMSGCIIYGKIVDDPVCFVNGVVGVAISAVVRKIISSTESIVPSRFLYFAFLLPAPFC